MEDYLTPLAGSAFSGALGCSCSSAFLLSPRHWQVSSRAAARNAGWKWGEEGAIEVSSKPELRTLSGQFYRGSASSDSIAFSQTEALRFAVYNFFFWGSGDTKDFA